MSIHLCFVNGCRNQVRRGLRRSIVSGDGLADGLTCVKHRAAERRRYLRVRCARCKRPRGEHHAFDVRRCRFKEPK